MAIFAEVTLFAQTQNWRIIRRWRTGAAECYNIVDSVLFPNSTASL